MQRLTKILETLPSPAYVLSVLDYTILVANRRAAELVPKMTHGGCPDGLVGMNLVDVCNYHHLDYDTHPAIRARHTGVHTQYYGHRDLTVVASRLADAPTRPPAVMVSGRAGPEEPLAVAEHMRVMTNFAIASAIDDVERSISIAYRMLASGMDRLHDVGTMWEERVVAYADAPPDPFAELSLMDAANERSERTSDLGIDLSDPPSSVQPVSQINR
jgi:hypothetical protein